MKNYTGNYVLRKPAGIWNRSKNGQPQPPLSNVHYRCDHSQEPVNQGVFPSHSVSVSSRYSAPLPKPPPASPLLGAGGPASFLAAARLRPSRLAAPWRPSRLVVVVVVLPSVRWPQVQLTAAKRTKTNNLILLK